MTSDRVMMINDDKGSSITRRCSEEGGIMKVVSPEIVDAISFPRRLVRTVFDDLKYVIRVILRVLER